MFLYLFLGLLVWQGVRVWDLSSQAYSKEGLLSVLWDYLWYLVNLGANALASVREQDWWIVLPSITFAFARVPIYVSSCHLVPCPVWGTCSWLINQLNMTRMFTLLPGSRWTWGWCLCLLGGTGLLIMFQFSSKFAITGALILTMLMTALGSLPPVQDYFTGSVSWGWSRFLNLYLVRYLYFAHSYRLPSSYLLPGLWAT